MLFLNKKCGWEGGEREGTLELVKAAQRTSVDHTQIDFRTHEISDVLVAVANHCWPVKKKQTQRWLAITPAYPEDPS